jgi:hypothetical protein
VGDVERSYFTIEITERKESQYDDTLKGILIEGIVIEEIFSMSSAVESSVYLFQE